MNQNQVINLYLAANIISDGGLVVISKSSIPENLKHHEYEVLEDNDSYYIVQKDGFSKEDLIRDRNSEILA